MLKTHFFENLNPQDGDAISRQFLMCIKLLSKGPACFELILFNKIYESPVFSTISSKKMDRQSKTPTLFVGVLGEGSAAAPPYLR